MSGTVFGFVSGTSLYQRYNSLVQERRNIFSLNAVHCPAKSPRGANTPGVKVPVPPPGFCVRGPPEPPPPPPPHAVRTHSAAPARPLRTAIPIDSTPVGIP